MHAVYLILILILIFEFSDRTSDAEYKPLCAVHFVFIFQKLFAVIGPPLREGRSLTGKARISIKYRNWEKNISVFNSCVFQMRKW